MAEPNATQGQDATDWPGQISNIGSRSPSPAAASLQVNLSSAVPGELSVRPGLKPTGSQEIVAVDDSGYVSANFQVPDGGGGDSDRIGLAPGEEEDEELPEAEEDPPTTSQRWIILSTDLKFQDYFAHSTPADDVGEPVGGIEDFHPSDPAVDTQQVSDPARPLLAAGGGLNFYQNESSSAGMNGFFIEDLEGPFTMYFSFERTTTVSDLVLIADSSNECIVLRGATSEYLVWGPGANNDYTGPFPDNATLVRFRRDADDVLYIRFTGEDEITLGEDAGRYDVERFGTGGVENYQSTETTAVWKSMLIYSADLAGTEQDLQVRAWLLENDGSTL